MIKRKPVQMFQLVCRIDICVYPIKCQCCAYIKTSQLICTANQLTCFNMSATLALNVLHLTSYFREVILQMSVIILD